MNAVTRELIRACQELQWYGGYIRILTEEFMDGSRSPEDLAEYVDDLRSFTFPLAVEVKDKGGYDGTIDFDQMAEHFVARGVDQPPQKNVSSRNPWEEADSSPRDPRTGRFVATSTPTKRQEPEPQKRLPSRNRGPGTRPSGSSGSTRIPFDEFLARLYSLMWKAQLASPAEVAAWGAQVQALLEHSIGDLHPFTEQFALAMIPVDRLGISAAYALLQAVREDAEAGHLRLENGEPYRSTTEAD